MSCLKEVGELINSFSMLNSHIHLFRDVDVPRDFLRFKLCQVMDNPIGYFIVKTLLHNIIPFTNKDKLD